MSWLGVGLGLGLGVGLGLGSGLGVGLGLGLGGGVGVGLGVGLGRIELCLAEVEGLEGRRRAQALAQRLDARPAQRVAREGELAQRRRAAKQRAHRARARLAQPLEVELERLELARRGAWGVNVAMLQHMVTHEEHSVRRLGWCHGC